MFSNLLFALANPVACANELLLKAQEAKMKQVIKKIEQPEEMIEITNVLKKLEQPSSRYDCDIVICYVSQGGLVATLEEYYDHLGAFKPRWCGFKYMRFDGSSFKFRQHTYRESMESAMNSGRTLYLFDNKYEFFNWLRKQPYYCDELA